MKKNLIYQILLLIFVLTTSQSCVKYREMVSLNRTDNRAVTINGEPLYESEVYPYEPHKIRPFDQLMIKINAFDGSTEDFLNREFKTENIFTRDIRFDPASVYFNTYSVDRNGYLYLPLVDSIYVAGLTTNDLKYKLDDAYKPHLKYAATSVKLANVKCTVIGEVNAPGVVFLYNNKNSLLDAIALCDGMTEFANRSQVKVVRTGKDGNTKTVYLDLTTYDFVRTEFYYVQPDDIIYIEPVKAKSFDSSSRAIGVVFSAISTVALIVNIFIR